MHRGYLLDIDMDMTLPWEKYRADHPSCSLHSGNTDRTRFTCLLAYYT
jgi:hypothetical protein